MNHDQIKAALSELRDGEIEPGDRADILAHLQQCADCAASYRLTERLGGLFKAATTVSPLETERFARAVMARRRVAKAAPASWAWLAPNWAAPTLAFVAASVFFAIAFPRQASAIDDLFAGPAFVAEQELDLIGDR
jgi:anti-sigma factor RsiW